MTWKPISTAPKDRKIDLWTGDGLHVPRQMWAVDNVTPVDPAVTPTHWREPDQGPGMEEGEVRWMLEFPRLRALLTATYGSPEEAAQSREDGLGMLDDTRVVRVRIVREEE